MINIYNRKAIPTENREMVRSLIERLKQEEIFKIHDINIEFGTRKARNLGNPLSTNDITCELSIGLKLCEDIFNDITSTSMVYSIYCNVNSHIESLDLSIAHEFGHIINYINNFDDKLAMSTNIDLGNSEIFAYNYIDELYANYYANKIMDELKPGYSEELARKVYVVMHKLVQSTSRRDDVIDLLIEVNSGIMGFIYNLAELIPTIYRVNKESRLILDNSFGELLHELENLSIELLNKFDTNAVINKDSIHELDKLIKEIKIIYE